LAGLVNSWEFDIRKALKGRDSIARYIAPGTPAEKGIKP
jgi:hypothetical protein